MESQNIFLCKILIITDDINIIFVVIHSAAKYNTCDFSLVLNTNFYHLMLVVNSIERTRHELVNIHFIKLYILWYPAAQAYQLLVENTQQVKLSFYFFSFWGKQFFCLELCKSLYARYIQYRKTLVPFICYNSLLYCFCINIYAVRSWFLCLH